MNSIKSRINNTVSYPYEETDPLQLLNTIKMPQKMHYLTDILPAPNYDPIKDEPATRMTEGRLTLGNLPSTDYSQRNRNLAEASSVERCNELN